MKSLRTVPVSLTSAQKRNGATLIPSSFTFLIDNIVKQPELLDLANNILYKDELKTHATGKYDFISVRKQGEKLLTELSQAEAALATNIFPDLAKLAKKVRLWQQKLHNLKNTSLMHGALTEKLEIVIYKTVLQQECLEHAWDFQAYQASVLAHERFHLLHRQSIGSINLLPLGNAAFAEAQAYWFGGGTNLDEVRTVKESLAEFLRYMWCVAHGHTALAQAICTSFHGTKAYFPGWPYAGANGLIKLAQNDEEMAIKSFYEIWQQSLQSWHTAYLLLEKINPEK
ncbi:MAG: hypothetical protein SO119_02290 [Phascolarctobacterium sp.]|nr:hypothetical protein [Phascolarctobacterium sp.]